MSGKRARIYYFSCLVMFAAKYMNISEEMFMIVTNVFVCFTAHAMEKWIGNRPGPSVLGFFTKEEMEDGPS